MHDTERKNDIAGELSKVIEASKAANLDARQDIAADEARRARQTLERRENMLDSLNRAAIILLSRQGAFEDAMTEGVGIIAGGLGIDRMSLFRNLDNPLHISQIYRWSKKSGGTTSPLDSLADTTYPDLFPILEEMLPADECVNGPIVYLPEGGRLKRFGCVSILAVPVFIGGRFWGFGFFEDTMNERYFKDHEINMLRSASFMLANVVIRNEQAIKLREMDERAQLMLHATPLGCILFNASHDVIDCNQAAMALFGFTDKQSQMKNFFKCSPEFQPDGRRSDVTAAAMLNFAARKGQHVFEWTHKALNGASIPAKITLVRTNYGGEIMIAGYIQDLREQQLMMRRIDQKARLLQAVNSIAAILLSSGADTFENDLVRSMGIIAEVVAADRVYVWKNSVRDGQLCCRQICEWSPGVEPQQDKGMGVLTPYHIAAPGWEDNLARGECINGIVRYFNKEQKAWLERQGILSILLVPIFLHNEFWGFIGFDDCHNERGFTDDEESIMRSASEFIADSLIRTNMEDTLRTTAEQLQAALTDTQAASRAKSEFLARMSHEMRTPLNAIMGMTTIGKRAANTSRKDYALDRISEASAHLLSIVNDILDISKAESELLEFSETWFSLQDMLEDAASFVRQSMVEKGHIFVMDIQEGIHDRLVGDAERLIQVIVHLLSNAAKFTPENGRITLSVTLTGESDGVYSLRFMVEDNGIGIPEDRRETIFQAFEQADGGVTRRFGGTGLGLSISKSIIEQMGGSIWAESTVDAGSKFIFTLDLRRAENPDADPVPIDPQAFAGKRLLVAEDVPINREILLALLEGAGLIIDVAVDGRQAFEMVSKTPGQYDLIFMDVQMPEMDGFETTRRIRSLDGEYYKSLPIIAMTANVYQSDIDNCLNAGMNDHIGKPLDLQVLMEKLRVYLG